MKMYVWTIKILCSTNEIFIRVSLLQLFVESILFFIGIGPLLTISIPTDGREMQHLYQKTLYPRFNKENMKIKSLLSRFGIELFFALLMTILFFY